MKKHPLYLASLFALIAANGASAEIRLSNNGVGDAVYLPYYSVDDSQASLITVNNSSDRATSARVVITEQKNGQAGLYFLLFLPPRAQWTAALTATSQGALLTSASSVCTVPTIPASGVELRNFDYAAAGNYPDNGGDTLQRTRTGAIEVIERGALSGNLETLTVNKSCSTLVGNYTPGASAGRAGQVGAPASGLSANVQVVNVSGGLVFPINGYAVTGHSTVARDTEVLIDDIERFSRPALDNGASEFTVEIDGSRYAFAGNRGPDAISSLFMTSRLDGEIHTETALGASTRWMLSFPTKHAYVASFPGTLVSSAAVAPFGSLFGANGACEQLTRSDYEFDGSKRGADTQLPLCFQQNLLNFTDNSGLARLTFDDAATRTLQARAIGGGNVTFRGLPVIGFRLSNFVNGAAQPGMLANYSVALPLQAAPSAVAADLR